MDSGCADLRERGGLPLIDIPPSDNEKAAAISPCPSAASGTSDSAPVTAPSAMDEAAPASSPPTEPGQLFPPDVPRTSPRRLICRNADFIVGKKAADPERGIKAFPGHKVTVNLAYTEQAELIEIGFHETGNVGHPLQLLFSELGLRLSRVIQGRDPSDEAHQTPMPEAA